jgi:AbrB family looped-hinge helix DNA binding protein
MALSRIQSRGQVTLPRAIRKAAGIESGDTVTFHVVGPGRVELRLLPRLRLAEALERYRIEQTVDEAADRDAWEAMAAEEALRG